MIGAAASSRNLARPTKRPPNRGSFSSPEGLAFRAPLPIGRRAAPSGRPPGGPLAGRVIGVGTRVGVRSARGARRAAAWVRDRPAVARLNAAFVVPAVLLGCVTVSAALFAGQAEIEQLRPFERRPASFGQPAAPSFRVMLDHSATPRPALEAAPPPSPLAASVLPVVFPVELPDPLGAAPQPLSTELVSPGLLVPGPGESLELPPAVEHVIEHTPGPASGPVASVVDTALDVVDDVSGSLGRTISPVRRLLPTRG
jgi:hypothetical protein